MLCFWCFHFHFYFFFFFLFLVMYVESLEHAKLVLQGGLGG